MIGRILAFAVAIGLFVSMGTVFLSVIYPARDSNGQMFGWPSPWVRTNKIQCNSFTDFVGNCPPFIYQFMWENLLIDWGIFSFIFFLLLIVLYKTKVLK